VAILFNVPNVNGATFPHSMLGELWEKRVYHNGLLRQLCAKWKIPLADICLRLKDEHFGDELHPNAEGAKIIAEEVFKLLASLHKESSK
jgi:hypothetical protein